MVKKTGNWRTIPWLTYIAGFLIMVSTQAYSEPVYVTHNRCYGSAGVVAYGAISSWGCIHLRSMSLNYG